MSASYTLLLNLVQLDPLTNGGTSIVGYETARAVMGYVASRPSVRLVIAVNARLAANFDVWSANLPKTHYILTSLDFHEPPEPLLQATVPDVVVSPIYGGAPFDVAAMAQLGVQHVVLMPDALPLLHPEYFPPRQLSKRRQFYADLHRATVVVAPTQHAAQTLRAHVQPPIEELHVIPYGADRLQNVLVDESAFRPAEPYLFYPASSWEHKNHDFLFRVMEKVWQKRPELQLVLTGGRTRAVSKEPLEHIERATRRHERIHDLGFVTPEHLKALYQHAEALVFPSSYEGFGIPVIEAMQLGCPVVCSDAACLPEVTNGAALMLAVGDVDMWAETICEQLPEERERLISVGRERAAAFRWADAGAMLIKLLQSLGLPEERGPAVPQDSYILQTIAEHRASADPPPPEILKMASWQQRLRTANNRQAQVYTRFRILVLVAKLGLRLMARYLRP